MMTYRHRSDAWMAAGLLVTQVFCLLTLAALVWCCNATAAQIWTLTPGRILRNRDLILYMLPANPGTVYQLLVIAAPLVVFTMVSALARRRLAAGSLRLGWHVMLLLALGGAFVAAESWFCTPMHDFALVVFQSHGRWGCRDVQSYWITDSTAPFLFVAPALFATLAHAAVEIRRRRRDGSLRLPGRRTVAILATVPLVLVVGLLASAQPWRFPPQGPMWQGKAFREWLDDSNPNVWRDPSVEILQTMETGLLVKTLRTYLNSVNPPSYYPGPGSHWASHHGISRGCLNEGQMHFNSDR